MDKSARINSILTAQTIGLNIQGVETFTISKLKINKPINYTENKPLRLGKEIEKVVSALISASSHFELIKENIQIQNGKITIGELDFIINDILNQSFFHLELVYKFYVYDPNQSENENEKWIGPNRKDSLIEKMDKLKNKQFPLLKHALTQSQLVELDCKNMVQKLCFMANLFVPYNLVNKSLPEINNSAIMGYWLNFKNFELIQNNTNTYYLPQKSEWGINPIFNDNWVNKQTILKQILNNHNRSFSPLCWIKKLNNSFDQCFVVWWS